MADFRIISYLLMDRKQSIFALSCPAVPKESPMRVLACTILTIGAMLVAAPARAQTYNPNFPVCLQAYSLGGGYIDCSFTSLAQCAGSASGRGGLCLNNPYFAQGDRKLPRRRDVY
jgi:Protein of unknown function (DUF3551)